MPFLVGAQHRRHAGHRGLFGHGGQRANRGAHGGAQVGVHRLGDVQRAEVAGHIAPDVLVAQILTERARLLHLQDLRTQVGHHHAPLDWVRPVDRVLEYQVGVAGFELQLGQRHEELPSVDPGLADALVGHHAIVFLGHADVGERFAVHPFHIVGAEQRHPFLAFGQFERDVRHHHAQRQRFDADLLVGILAFGVQEAQDVRVVRVEVHRARSLPRAQLVGVGERVLQQFHHGHHAAGLVFDLLDRGAQFAQVAQQQCHAAAPLAQLERGVDAARDRFHVVLDADQEAADRLAPLRLAQVQERRGGGLEAARDDLVGHTRGHLLVAGGQRQRHGGRTLREILQVSGTVEGLQRV